MTYLTHIDPKQNKARWYRLHIQPTLFGECSVIRSWGRLQTKGRTIETKCATEQDAVALAAKIADLKQRRGYRLALMV